MSFDSITEAATRRLGRRPSRRRVLGLFGGAAAAAGLGALAWPSRAAAQGTATFTFVNNTGQTIWPGALGNAGQSVPNGGGWELSVGQSLTVTVPDTWAGRFWARTYCTLNAGCPAARQDVASSGNIIACLSACSEFGTDQYCCTGVYGSPSTCNPD